MTEPIYPPLPESFRPELLCRLSLKEVLLLSAQFGILQVAERIGYEQLVESVRKISSDTDATSQVHNVIPVVQQ